MQAIWTMLCVAIYIGGTLGPDGTVTGKIAVSSLLLAAFVWAGFAAINWFHAYPVVTQEN